MLMTKNQIFLMILFCMVAFQVSAQNQDNGKCIEECKKLQFKDCRICYKNCSPPQNHFRQVQEHASRQHKFEMQKCYEKYCSKERVEHYYDNSYNNGYNGYNNGYSYNSYGGFRTRTVCVEHSERELPEQKCIQTCCHDAVYKKFTDETFNKCVATDQQMQEKVTNIFMIIMIVIGAIILIVTVVIICTSCGCADSIKNRCFNR